MDIIRTYLDNMFMNLPKTDEVEKAKKALLEMMEDKYHEQKEAGKTENEAVGIVISEFGNLEELAEELGIASYMRPEEHRESGNYRQLSFEEVRTYMEENMKFGAKIGIGVMLCICSMIVWILLESIAGNGDGILSNSATGIGLIVMLLMIASAVGLFIYNGMKQSSFEYLKKEPFCLDYSTETYVREDRKSFQPVFAVCITLGVILCILSLVPIFISEMIFAESVIPGAVAVSLMFFLVSIGVFLFIFSGVRYSSYQVLLQEGEYQQKKKKYKSLEAISSVYWSIMVCVYLFWSFSSGNWGFTWVIWPIAGIFYGVIESIIKAIMKD